MSKKRTSTESNSDDEPTKEGSEAKLQKEDSAAEHVQLDLLSDTTLEDLPIELFECILVKVVTMEVWRLKLAKSVWKEKADLVLSRLAAVSPHWNSILTSSLFRNELHRVLDFTAQKIRFTVLNENYLHWTDIRTVAPLLNEFFVLYRKDNRDCVDNARTINNVFEMVEDIVQLRDTDVVCMVSCDVANCVYVGLRNKNDRDPSVLRISRNADRQFSMWLNYYHRLPVSTMSVSANGNLVILSLQQGEDPGVVSIYNANGSMQKEIILSPDIDAARCKTVIQKFNGNVVLACVNDQTSTMKLLEIDMSGSVVREYQSSFSKESFVSFADIYDRIMIAEPLQGTELLDSEFNLLDTYSLEQDKGRDLLLSDLHYSIGFDKILRIHFDRNTETSWLTCLRFTED